MKVLWLVSWYPSRLAPFNGDFIRRHAQAVSLYDKVDVIYVIRDEKGSVTRKKKVEKTQSKNLEETIIYYYSAHNPFSILDKAVSELKYRRYYKKAIKNYIKAKGRPDIVHLHVALKAGSLARWIKRKYKINYLLTEHWTGLLSEAQSELGDASFFLKKMVTGTIRKAKAISTVSAYLAMQLKKKSVEEKCIVIPNVVDTSIFYPAHRRYTAGVNFLHISTLGYQKNPEDILRAFAVIKQNCENFHLDIVGPEKKQLVEMASSLNLQDYVSFHSEMPQEELVKYMHNANALLLYSRYETFGCVIIEANACGLPVIVSDIPVMNEIVKANFNGVLVKGEDPQALANTITAFIQNKYQFDSKAVSGFIAGNYSYEYIGRKFHDWYLQMKD